MTDSEDVHVEILSMTPALEHNYAIANQYIKFENKSLDEWRAEISFPYLSENMSIEDAFKLNVKMMNISDIIISKLSSSRAQFGTSKLKYVKSMLDNKKAIIAEYNDRGARVPGVDTIDNLAKQRSTDEYLVYKLSEIVFDFWKDMADKMKIYNDRTTSLNIVKNIESKYSGSINI